MIGNKKISLTYTLASLLMLGSVGLNAGTWNGGTSTNVSTATNWTPNSVQTGLVATFNDTGTTPDTWALPGTRSFLPDGIIFANTSAGTFTLIPVGGGGGNSVLTIGFNGVTSTAGVTNTFSATNAAGNSSLITISGPVAGGTTANIVNYNLSSAGSGTANTLTLHGGGQVQNGIANVNLTGSQSVTTRAHFTVDTIPATLNSLNASTFDLVQLDNTLTLVTDSTIDGTITETIAGAGSITVLGGTLILTNDNTATGTLTITGGTVSTQNGASTLGNQVTNFTSIVNNAILELDQSINATLTMPITGTGFLLIDGGETITLTNTANTYSGGTTVSLSSTVSINDDRELGGSDVGALTLNVGTLVTTAAVTLARPVAFVTTNNVINTGVFSDTISGAMTGDLAGFTKQGSGSLTLTGIANTYSGGTTIAANGGTLIGATQNFPAGGAIDILGTGATAGTLNFVQTANGDFTGVLSGTGDITLLNSTARVTLTADSSTFTGVTSVPVGELSTNTGAVLGGTVNLSATGILSGTGTYGIINQTGGQLHPGHSPGIMFATTYNPTGGIFAIDVNNGGTVAGTNNGILEVSGVATLTNGTTVQVTSANGSFSITGPYTILTAGTLVGEFNPVVTTINALTSSPLSVEPVLLYVGNDVFLDFQSGFLASTTNRNQFNVATQLTLITAPTANETILLDNITALSTVDRQLALDELSGSQYAQLMNATEWSNDEFIRRLYDPLRQFLTTSPCCYSPCNCDDNVEFWVEGSALQSRIRNTNAAYGYKNSGYEVGLGVQINQDACWSYGAAVTYEKGNVHFDIGGHGKTNTLLGALYGAYRNEDFYLLGDLVLGGSSNKVNRSFFVGDVSYAEQGKPKSFQGALYVEGGMNFFCENLVFQPFLGFEGGYYNQHSFNESGTDPVALGFHKRSYGTVDSRLGVHVTSELSNCGFSVGLDLAWQCRISELQDHRTAFFEDFGTDFVVDGSNINRNSLDAAINLTQKVNDCWGFYVTGNGRFWNNAYAYDVVGGISVNW